MLPAPPQRPRRRAVRLDVALLATAGVLLLTTLLPLIDTSLNIVIVDRTLDVAVTSLTLVATAGLAVLALLRYRETGRLALYVQASSFVLWASFSGIVVLLALLKLDGRLGLTLGLPEQLPAWISMVTRILVAGLFLLSGVAALRRMSGGPGRQTRRLFVPVFGVVLLSLFLFPIRDLLPPLIEPVGIEAMLAGPGQTFALPGITPVAIAFVMVTALGLAVAAILYRITWARGGPASDSFTALGLVALAVAEAQHALWPSVYVGLVTISDLMRLLAYTVLVAGTIAEQRSDLRALRSAYAALDRMRVNEGERAKLEERSRLAREIHDGLAQHLWFAKLKLERLNSTLDESQRPLAGEVTQAIDTALVEAREALVAMRSGLDQDLPFVDMLTRTVDDFGRRSGLRVEVSAAPGIPAALPPRQQVEVLRIVQEALTNVRKHADATMVRVRAEVVDGSLVLAVADNGRGFVPDDVFEEGLGLQGMRERARLIGGELQVETEASGGTTVEVRTPILTPQLPGPSEGAPASTRADGTETQPWPASAPASVPTPTPDARVPDPLQTRIG